MPLRALRGSAASLVQRVVRHPVTRDAFGFGATTSLVKAVAFVKEAVVASAFGVGTSMDSYLMALVVISFPSGVLANAAQTVFIREYVRSSTVRGEVAAARLLRTATLTLLLALTVLLVAWFTFLPAILSVIGHGLAPPQRALVSANAARLIPYYYLSGVNLLGYGVLQSRRAYVRAALIPIATPVLIMTFVTCMHADLTVLIEALTLGTAVEGVLIVVFVAKAHKQSAGRAPQAYLGLRDFVWGSLVLVPGTLMAGLAPVIEQTIASGLGRGTISALGYASKLPATLNTLLTTAVGVTVLPYFSQRLADGDEESCRRFLVRYVIILAVVGTTIAALAALGSGPFVRAAFQRGEFSAQHALVVTSLQRAYLWQLPGALVGIVAGRFAAAQGRYRVLTIGSMLMVPITGLLQWGLSMTWGAAGLAFGASVGTALSAIALMWLALRSARKPAR